ncbi:phosphoribosylglycinamide formyltransferase [Oceanobacillus sp. 143]|uniref:Phosphoribosylglycinamide formyltransferase n=1 Tax=Oceanobacillus zhaokaii TaxID=2052660 RepID=A0A345PDW5_9BACI|nr:phosphoribosylglycinamide formyltransferase [Oceanobacillus zhaokaii]AXI08195.1 phosphoribosylglycinamide formyltransferase [Oceanobacillus zhaokaii]QGS68133.1 phosphoribosylglycinamide formyltransferase [Oceanobacillus sp. 143]
MSKLKAAVFASGAGSNFQAIIEARDLACEIVLLICDKQNAGVIEIAKKHQISTFVFNAKEFASKQAYEEKIISELRKKEVSWIFLAGYMRIVGSTLLQAFPGKIVNIHPSLLPNFPGKDAIAQAYQAGVNKTGVTVHYIDEGIDTGPIIAQESVAVFSKDTEEALKKKIQEVEHQLYPSVINQLLQTK